MCAPSRRLASHRYFQIAHHATMVGGEGHRARDANENQNETRLGFRTRTRFRSRSRCRSRFWLSYSTAACDVPVTKAPACNDEPLDSPVAGDLDARMKFSRALVGRGM